VSEQVAIFISRETEPEAKVEAAEAGVEMAEPTLLVSERSERDTIRGVPFQNL